MTRPAEQLAFAITRIRDTCNVYVLRSGREAVLIDLGSGAVLDRLAELGVDRVTDVLVTHHHRDQVQGLRRAAEAGIRIWVPPYERKLIADVDRHWETRQVENDYDLREDRFSLLEGVPVTGAVEEYATRRYGAIDVYTLPTPGHTAGSVTYLVDDGGRRVAFSGDLVYGEGQLWSAAATQWSYSGVEGQTATFVSCGVLTGREPDVLLPAHGDPIEEPARSLELLRARIQELVNLRMEAPWNLADWQAHAWATVTPHVLRDRSAFATSYALLSETGAALLFDWGYHVSTGLTPQAQSTARRPLLASLEALRRDHGVERVEAVVTTHYHDDHVAGLNLIRRVEGTEVWAPENVAPILEDPRRYDLPCLWFEPIPVDRTLELGEPVRWHEHTLTVHALPGHTLYAAAISFDVDGRSVLVVGDQHTFGPAGSAPNYQYRNRFRIGDYVAGAELYRALGADLLLTGHWNERGIDDGELDRMLAQGRRLEELHRELLPFDEVDFGAEGFGARIEPYRSTAAPGGRVELDVWVRNPFARPELATVALVLPTGWEEPPAQQVQLAAGGEATLRFELTAPTRPVRRARVGADLTVGEAAFGQQAEALVDVE